MSNDAPSDLALTGRQPSVRAAEELRALQATSLRHPYNLAASMGRPTEPNMPSTSCYFTAPQDEVPVRALAYDLGVNQAGDARHLLHKGYRVVSVEADPYKYRKHMADPTLSWYRHKGQWTLLNVALVGRAAAATNVTFYINFRKPDSSSTSRRLACGGGATEGASRTCEAVSVPTITCGELLSRFGNGFYLKSDVEGAEGV